MAQKYSRKGALLHFCKFKITPKIQAANGALCIIDNSRE
jgi:hypothetical protein